MMGAESYFKGTWTRYLISSAEAISGSKVTRYLEFLDKTSRLSPGELKIFRWEKLKRLLDHAYTFVPYYQSIMKGAGLTPDDVRSMDDFKRIPILTKSLIRENLGGLTAAGSFRKMRVVRAQTGGTTGEPLKFLRDADCISFTRAALLRSYTWTGYRIGDPMLFLTGGSLLAAPQTMKQRVGFSLMNFHFLPGFRLKRESLTNYVNLVRKERIRYLRGYSTLILQFAVLCEEAGIDGLEFAAVYPTAEMLTKAQRDTIERVFHCRIFDQYGCAEVNSIANECPERRNLHIIEEHVILEEMDLDGSGGNALVVTDLDNYAQPFIRYSNADRGKLADGLCACGRNLSVLEEFLGRSSDAIYLKTGEGFPGVFFHHLFGHFEGVTQFQIIQDEPEKLHIKIIRNVRYSNSDEENIKRIVAEHTGFIPEIDYCSEIERSASGKITSVICNVSPREG